MSKIVTLFFEEDCTADEFLKSVGNDYYSFTETVTSKRLNRTINMARYQKAKCSMPLF
jgi:hypothetical protein